jgi:hypothetical protein
MKTVRFSETSKLLLFKKPSDEDNKNKSYTKQDFKRFHQEKMQDVIRCSKLFLPASNSGDGVNVSIEESCLCIGLEFMITPDVPKRMQRIQKARKRHVKRVLDQQALSRNSNDFSQDSIARVARRSSFETREHASTVAAAAALVSLCDLYQLAVYGTSFFSKESFLIMCPTLSPVDIFQRAIRFWSVLVQIQYDAISVT